MEDRREDGLEHGLEDCLTRAFLCALGLAVATTSAVRANDAGVDFRIFAAPLPDTQSGPQVGWDFPGLRPLAPDHAGPLGKGLARTMGLLAGSTPQQRNQVRILVYGQSLSKQTWAGRVREELVKRYPNADIEFHNLAIGGFVSTMLKRTLEQDVIPLYPDLVILHDFGTEADYEEIVRQIRTRTTAELLLQNDPWTPDQKSGWHDEHSWTWLPALAARWGAEVVDIRSAFRDYAADQHLSGSELLNRDRTHLNDRGNFVWAEATLRHFRSTSGGAASGVRMFTVGKDVSWHGDKLVFEFSGNRVDVIADPRGAAGAAARVQIDGKAPSQRPELYSFTRPNADANRDWPWSTGAIIRVDRQAPLLLEDWTLTFTRFTPEGTKFAFDVMGSKTGYDGSGESDKPFVSQSGRVVLSPQDWFISRMIGRPGANRIAVGYKVVFSVRPQFTDTYIAPATPNSSRSYATTLAQGLPAGRHVLQLFAPRNQRPIIKAIRVYSPMLGPTNAPLGN